MPALRGPDGAIGYTRDDLGYPSFEANSLEAASWASGWFHAHDRLVQVQLMLAVARGRALELIGDIPLARYSDRMTRLHRFTDDLEAQVAQLSPEVLRLLNAYGAGFDAGARSRGWPLLLRAARIPPRGFRPADFILLLRLLAWFGLNQLVEMATLTVGELVAARVPREALALLVGRAATAEELAAPPSSWPAELSMFVGAGAGGSNAIAISSRRSATGGALLAADPHMEIARIPPVLYASHGSYGGDAYLQGLHVPGFWYPSFGRNARVAWAYTYGRVQNIDVRVVRCRRGEMFDGSSWRPLARRTATVAIKKRPPETWTFWDGPLGTIVGDAGGATELALPCVQWSGVRDAYKDANAGLALVRAKDVEAATAANRSMALFALDGLVADATGRIGHVVSGRMDARSPSSGGVIPRAPDGAPVAPFAEATRPMTIDPPEGWLVSANARPIEASGEVWVPMADTPARLHRLRTLVGERERVDLSDLATFVHDASDACAARLLAAWAPHLPDHPRARGLVAWAAAQPGEGATHFAQLTLWTALHLRVCRVLLWRHLGARADFVLDTLQGLQLFRHHLDEALALERPAALDAGTLRSVLVEAFPLALADAELPAARLPRRDRFKNALLDGKLGWLFDSRPVENRGGPTTPNQVTALSFGDRVGVFGSAGRYLCDVSKPGGWYSISGGASERRLKLGYGLGIEDWARGRYRPLGKPVGRPPAAR